VGVPPDAPAHAEGSPPVGGRSLHTNVAAVVITRNEEANLARCLESLRPVARELVVVDSGSTDRTRERLHGALDHWP
jgi:hypothetical protein